MNDTTGAVFMYSDNWGETWSALPLSIEGSIVDITLAPGEWTYFATQYDGVYRFRWVPVKTSPPGASLPVNTELAQNYPNPFNAATTIRYTLEKAGPVELSVVNVRGETVKVLVDGIQSPGVYCISWNADQVESGVYFYRLQTPGTETVRKMVVLK